MGKHLYYSLRFCNKISLFRGLGFQKNVISCKKYYILLAEMGFSIYICSPNNENMKTNMVLHVVIVDILSLNVGQM